MGWGKGRKINRRQFLAKAGILAASGSVIALSRGRNLKTEAQTPDAPPIVKVLVNEIEGSSIALRTAGAGGAAFTSPAIASSFPFTHVALRWSPQDPQPELSLRTSPDAQKWSDWHELGIEANHDENPRGQVFSHLVAADGHLYMQYRVAPPGASSPPAVGAIFINSSDGPRIPRPAPQTSSSSSAVVPAVQRPPVVTREQWGADESIRFYGDFELWSRTYVPVKKVVVHHTATTNDYSDPAAEVRAVYTYHAQTLGWRDIGYNALIGNDGQIYEGRHGRVGAQYAEWGREVLSEDIVAGHANDHNLGTAGVSLIGNFQEFDLPENMYQTLLAYLEFECRRHGILPNAVADFLRTSDEWNRGLSNVPGHRDVGATECPGERVYARLPQIRQTLVDRLKNGAAPTAHSISMADGPEPGDFHLTFGWRGADSTTPQADIEYSYFLEGWQYIPGSAVIGYLSGYKEDRTPAWSAFAKGTSAKFYLPDRGHYTFHVRARDKDGVISPFEANHTFLWSPDHHRSFLPGLAAE